MYVVAGKLREALLSSVARPSAQAAAPAAEAKGLEDWFYEEAWEAVRLSALRPTVAAVLLDGPEELPEGMPKAVFTTWQRAVPAAKAAGEGFECGYGYNTHRFTGASFGA